MGKPLCWVGVPTWGLVLACGQPQGAGLAGRAVDGGSQIPSHLSVAGQDLLWRPSERGSL